jgi:peptidoglycan hydrolase-like protein with peptidoglycan-binding domain
VVYSESDFSCLLPQAKGTFKVDYYFPVSFRLLIINFNKMKTIFFAFFLATMFAMAPYVHATMLDRQLEIAMSGSDVSSLQSFLAQDKTIYPQGLVTGYFGFLTKSAVSNFQTRNGIDPVGRVGPLTLAAINSQMNGGKVGADRISPTIYSSNVNTTSSSATLSWNTDEGAAAIVYYSSQPLVMVEAGSGTAVNISGSTLLLHSDLRTAHSGTLAGLQSNTTYYYVVYARDGQGNESVTREQTFKTSN